MEKPKKEYMIEPSGSVCMTLYLPTRAIISLERMAHRTQRTRGGMARYLLIQAMNEIEADETGSAPPLVDTVPLRQKSPNAERWVKHINQQDDARRGIDSDGVVQEVIGALTPEKKTALEVFATREGRSQRDVLFHLAGEALAQRKKDGMY